MSNIEQKSKNSAHENLSGTTYRSGAAARLSGVPVETLRVWERRYGVTEPHRSARGQRLYSFDDVRRLGLIKQLVDAGNSIGAIAGLELQQLLAMSGAALVMPAPQSYGGSAQQALVRIALIGAHLRHSLLDLDQGKSLLSVTQTVLSLDQAATHLKDMVADIIIIELGEITAPGEQISLIRDVQQVCHAKAVLVLYRFSSSDAIRQLRQAACYVARIPSDIREVENLCHAALAQAQLSLNKPVKQLAAAPRNQDSKRLSQLPQRLLTDDTLAYIAKSAVSIHCECPRHLVELLQMLESFERYSAQCENQNDDDALIHRDLHHTAAHARSTLEQALVRVARAEGILLS